MKKRLGWILALCLGGAGLYYAANTHSTADAAYQQSSSTSQSTQTNQPNTATPQPTTQNPQPALSNDSHYTNSDGDTVHSPALSSAGVPDGATAVCGDGTYSFSQHRRGTCSHHGGVARWL